ncbi:MAG: permease-like cell division protein FtsX [Oscillospiraceae bacterium]|nr:permease-like cell division protein FtsX [Oscillospiraceae bacterium]
MKLRSFKHLLGGGLKNIWANKLMSVASVGILIACMSIIGLAYILTENVNKTLGEIEQQNVVMVYFNDINSVRYGGAEKLSTGSNISAASDSSTAVSSTGAESSVDSSTTNVVDPNEISDEDYLIHTEQEALALCEKIRSVPNVASAEFVSSEAGLEKIKQNMLSEQSEYFSFLDGDNPLSCGAKVTMTDLSLFDETLANIQAIDGVDTIQSQGDIAAKITSIKNGVQIAAWWIIGILFIISLVIVSNTIRVTMYNRKLEISIMKAVGATDWYIRIPFLVEGVTLGLVSALFTTGLLYFIYQAVVGTMKNALSISQVIPYSNFAWLLFGIFAVIGVVSGFLSSLVIIGKYLRKEGSEFRAI